MIRQMIMTTDGSIKDKVEMSIELLKRWEPEEGYIMAFSGGKDSQGADLLCQMAGVKVEEHYSVTSVDPPELVRFIRKDYPHVIFDHKYDEKGKPITMWNLIPRKLMPPTRIVRYCCEVLKESHGKYRRTVTGVRWEESQRRKANHGMVTIPNIGKRNRKRLDEESIDYTATNQGGIILNYDNDKTREVIQRCVRTSKFLVNPIVNWTTNEVWEFLEGEGIRHCCLYDEGFDRIGCIGCPMARPKRIEKEFARWPKYRELYLKAFGKMIEERHRRGLYESDNFETPESVMNWWIYGGEKK